jgi:hypothetical protein
MAKKVPAKKAAASRGTATAAPSSGAEDLQTIHPDIEVEIAGREIVMREYGHIEGLQLRPRMAEFTRDLHELIVGSKSELLFEDIFDMAGAHVEAVRFAMAQSMAEPGKPANAADIEWISALGALDGERAMEAWWTACGPFFLRRVTKRMGERAWRARMSAGQTSTSHSLTPATANPPSSADTPNASSASSSNG